MAATIRLAFDENAFRIGTGDQNLWEEPRVSEIEIDEFEDDRYRVIKPITIQYERLAFGYMASFKGTSFAVSGISKQDAYQALEVEILDAFDDWTKDGAALGPGPRQQLAILKAHIERC